MPPDPLSYNMSDVNPHLTRCEPPPDIKAGSAPAFILSFIINMTTHLYLKYESGKIANWIRIKQKISIYVLINSTNATLKCKHRVLLLVRYST